MWGIPWDKPVRRLGEYLDGLLPLLDGKDADATGETVTTRGAVSVPDAPAPPVYIAALGPQGLLVNVARGSVVDEDALIAALRSGGLGGAALDVFIEEPTPAERWADVPNVVLTPHDAGGTIETVPRMAALAVENIRLHLAGAPLTAEVPA